MNFQHLKSLAFISVPEDWKDDFYADLVRQNAPILVFFLPLILLFQALNMVNVLFFSNAGLSTWNNRSYFFLYAALFLASLLLFILIKKRNIRKKGDARKILMFGFVYATFFVLWGVLISLMDMRTNDHILVYAITMIGISMLIYLQPWQMLCLYLGGQAVFLLLLPLFYHSADFDGILINSTSIMAISSLISFSRFRGRCMDFKNRKIILLQNEKITEINRQLQLLVITDTLSGLHSRRFMETVLEDKWKAHVDASLSAAVIMVDIDDFKKYNDYYGHQAGDQCIKSIADAITECINSGDNYAIRYGGEEFTIILFNPSQESAVKIASLLCKAVENLQIKQSPLSDHPVITISEGVYYHPADSEYGMDESLHLADEALYQAKQQGKNRVVLYEKN